jgi:hypothetical protein
LLISGILSDAECKTRWRWGTHWMSGIAAAWAFCAHFQHSTVWSSVTQHRAWLMDRSSGSPQRE